MKLTDRIVTRMMQKNANWRPALRLGLGLASTVLVFDILKGMLENKRRNRQNYLRVSNSSSLTEGYLEDKKSTMHI